MKLHRDKGQAREILDSGAFRLSEQDMDDIRRMEEKRICFEMQGADGILLIGDFGWCSEAFANIIGTADMFPGR